MSTDLALRRALVREIAAGGALGDPALRAAFEDVPRHLFVPYYYEGAPGGHVRLWGEDPDPGRRARWLTGAYADAPLGTRMRDGDLVSSSSQPSLMARMLQALELDDGDRVLEIGAGTGYNAALLCHRLGEDRVTTVDLEPEITEAARAHLATAGYRPAVITGDGARGAPARAPFDKIVATCTVGSVPHDWLAQCRPAALVLTPLATGLIRLRVTRPGRAEGRFLHTPAYFVPLRGSAPGALPGPPVEGPARDAASNELFRFLLQLTAGSLDPYAAYELWRREERPRRERFGVTVEDGAQWAWLDDPQGPHTWPLRGAPFSPGAR
ncbi:methyltransferase domain-containing protein [Streptomyces sp. NBC_00083]|uniref:methyltransferase domain-containing protein n=1 Tax=Streptomyces sp. NBC_00083 TaxID=2975647 RepID=UPI0022506D90|nr:methyltransferase domain-containing protein [Streptomyces sp. NBC_00083]MCX5382382.1 methyltransferase domain-containing protein [Streptomyces sp. NBC_00083]